MNKYSCIELICRSTEANHGVIVFNKHFKDDSVWSNAFSNNISTKIFDYNEHLRTYPEDVYDIENDMVIDYCRDNPMIRCKDFTRVLTGQKVGRMEKFVGKVLCKLDVEYSMIHVWFSRIDAEELYTYLGCIKTSDLHMNGIETKFNYD